MMWEVGYNDDTPYIPFTLNGVEQIGTVNNFEAYTHENPYELIDHIWIISGYRRRQVLGVRMWRCIVPEFDELVTLIDEHGFNHVHTEVPLDADLESYIQFQANKLNEERPEWLK